MHRTGLRPKVGSPTPVEVDVPLGVFTAGQLLRYNGTTGEIDTVAGGGGGSGDVVGPASAVNNDIAVFDTTTGKLIKDGGTTIAALQAATAARGDFSGPASSNNGTLVSFNGTTGKLGQDTGIVASRVVTGPVTSTTGNAVAFNNTAGNVVADAGYLAADVVRGPASTGAGNVAIFNGSTGKLISNSGIPGATVVTGPLASNLNEFAIFSNTSGNAVASSGLTSTGYPRACRVTTDQTITTTGSLQNVTNMNFTIQAAGSYSFCFDLMFANNVTTASVSVGATYSGTVPAAPNFSMGGVMFITPSSVVNLVTTTLGTATALSGTRTIPANTNTLSTFSGTLLCTGTGTLQFQIQTSTNGLIVRAGSGGRCVKI